MSTTIAIPTTSGRWLHFYYGDERIEFERVPRRASRQRVAIKVHPDCRVVAAAPEQADDGEVLAAVKRRGRWVYQQLREFRQQQEYLTPRRYVSGESHYYLGRQYVLKVSEDPDQVQGVKLLRGRLEVTVRRAAAEKVPQLLADWYRSRAREVFARRLDVLLEQTLWVSVRPTIRVQAMKTQWGSCSRSGRLTLNPHLVKAPQACIDYVILHELCHIAEHNHSERFYRLLGQVMPGWERTKIRLDGMASIFLASA